MLCLLKIKVWLQEFKFMLVLEEMSGMNSQTSQLFAADGFTAES